MRTSALLVPLALASLPFLACSSDKNHADRAEAAAMDPSTVTIDYNDEAAMKAACIGACKPDPGSKAVDVAAAQKDYEFVWGWDFSEPNGAKATYTYDDNTSNLVVPKRAISMVGFGQGGWEPYADMVPSSLPGPTQAVRFKGGPFTEYGGGFGQSLLTISNSPSRATLAPLLTSISPEFPGISVMDPTGGAYDLRTWDGLAIWVRRGPDGQSTMRIGITEKHSAEDLNSQALADLNYPGVVEGKYCKRWRICGCSGGTPCTLGPDSNYHCYDPSLESPSAADLGADQIKYPSCGTTRCQQNNTSSTTPDPLFSKIATPEHPEIQAAAMCNPAVTADGRSDSYCWDPAIDPKPPAKRERCNNPFSRAFTVTTDWQLIKVPFSELRQADEAQVADGMDLSSVKQLVVTYGGGWIDFWVANVGFYRAAPGR